MAGLVVGAGALGAAARLLPDDSPIGWLFRIAGASLAVIVVPGVLTVLAWRPRARVGLLELVAIGAGVGFGLTQLLTVGAVLVHWSPPISLGLLAAWSVAHAIVAWRAADRVEIETSWWQAGLLLTLAALAVFLYTTGSQLSEGEEGVHVAIVERLTHLPSPALDNIYFAPGIVYTYPFPGTHYLLALVGRLADVDALFLYHKMRMAWGCLAVILLYGCARVLTASERIALVTAFVAVAFVANGVWGAVPGLYWAQMAPYSHASDVAMGVLLPALLLLALEYLDAATRRERRFFFVATLAMAFMMMVTHAREIVQFAVYLTAFAVAMLPRRDTRPLAVRTATLVAATVVILGIYLAWHSAAVTAIDTLMAAKRQDLRQLWRDASIGSLVSFPLPLLRNYMPAFGPMFLGFYPIVLLVSPLVLFALRRRTLLWLVAAGTVVYALTVRLPLLGIPYIYLTYFEILYSPVRNFVFFVYLLTGITLFLAAARLAQLGYVAGSGLALALGVGAGWAVRRSEPFFTTHPEWFFLPLLAGYAIALAVIVSRRDRPGGRDAWIDDPPRPWIPVLAAMVAPLIVMTTVADSSLRTMSWERSRQKPPMFAEQVCDSSHAYCPPPDALVHLAHSAVPPEAVFALDQSEQWPPSLFMPQQMAMWPGRTDALYEPEKLFAAYYRHFDRARRKYETQPFFNDRETREERVEFIRDVGVTHVLVNPRTYGMMTTVLARDPDLFEKRYDDGRWALYEITPASARP